MQGEKGFEITNDEDRSLAVKRAAALLRYEPGGDGERELLVLTDAIAEYDMRDFEKAPRSRPSDDPAFSPG